MERKLSLWEKAKDFVLRRLLIWVRDDFKGWWPTEATARVARSVTSHWATELVITRPGNQGYEILLTVYDGAAEEFRGLWHLPGGYNRPQEQRDVEGACNAVACRELGVAVEAIYANRFRSPHYWWRRGEHPHGKPLSIFVECDLAAAVEETAKRRFFPITRLPEDMVAPHRKFIVEQLRDVLAREDSFSETVRSR